MPASAPCWDDRQRCKPGRLSERQRYTFPDPPTYTPQDPKRMPETLVGERRSSNVELGNAPSTTGVMKPKNRTDLEKPPTNGKPVSRSLINWRAVSASSLVG